MLIEFVGTKIKFGSNLKTFRSKCVTMFEKKVKECYKNWNTSRIVSKKRWTDAIKESPSFNAKKCQSLTKLLMQ